MALLTLMMIVAAADLNDLIGRPTQESGSELVSSDDINDLLGPPDSPPIVVDDDPTEPAEKPAIQSWPVTTPRPSVRQQQTRRRKLFPRLRLFRR